MPSLISGFTYDIFISYRQKDNRSLWVTNFVNALRHELDATFKEEISIYFDENPHDGLLETHEVAKSLEGKLKCVIMIPIVSHTYCDPKSYAWQHEFCAFNKLAANDELGMDVTLANGNVTKRILPVKIHELDEHDTQTIEAEIGGRLRAIEFIFKSPGVNRPLMHDEDHPAANQNGTFYNNQINKVANSIKEITSSLKRTGTASPGPSKPKSRLRRMIKPKRTSVIAAIVAFIALAAVYFYYPYEQNSNEGAAAIKGNSVAVLPFMDLSPNKDQEYLGDGIAEEIISMLSEIADLKVIGRSSSFSFKGENADLKYIGRKLDVATILEGSVSKSGDRIRVRAQLSSAEDGSQIWSQTFDEEMSDIFAIQDEISKKVLEKFKLTLTVFGQDPPTRHIEAYELYLQGKRALSLGIRDSKRARDLFARAVQLDPNFVEAHLLLGEAYFDLALYSVEDPTQSIILSKQAVHRAYELAPNSPRVVAMLGFFSCVADWDWQTALDYYEKAYALNKGPFLMSQHAYVDAAIYGRSGRPIEEIEGLLENDPLSTSLHIDLSRLNLLHTNFRRVISIGEQLQEEIPGNTSILRHMAGAYYFLGEYEKSLTMHNELLKVDSTYAVYGNVACLVKLDRKQEAEELYNKVAARLPLDKKAICLFQLGDPDGAYKYLNEAVEHKLIYALFIKSEPFWDEIRDEPRFQEIIAAMNFPEEEVSD